MKVKIRSINGVFFGSAIDTNYNNIIVITTEDGEMFIHRERIVAIELLYDPKTVDEEEYRWYISMIQDFLDVPL